MLDVAAGTGNAAVPAALTGAEVVAPDLTPELFAAGRAFAARHGVTVAWEEGDAEALPYADDSFDVVLSCVGVMFAPHHQRAADELVRVCRPGGRIGLLSWTPTGFVGEMFRTMKPYAPPPPPGAQPPPLWGDEDHVRALLGDRVTDVVARRRTLTIGPLPDARGVAGATGRASTARRSRPTAASRPTPREVAALDRDLTDARRAVRPRHRDDRARLGVPAPHGRRAGLIAPMARRPSRGRRATVHRRRTTVHGKVRIGEQPLRTWDVHSGTTSLPVTARAFEDVPP